MSKCYNSVMVDVENTKKNEKVIARNLIATIQQRLTNLVISFKSLHTHIFKIKLRGPHIYGQLIYYKGATSNK